MNAAMTVKQQIITFLQNHPEGVDDDELAKALDLSSRQQANILCRGFVKKGLVDRRQIDGKIHNFWVGKDVSSLHESIIFNSCVAFWRHFV